jgi:hypothetical protein
MSATDDYKIALNVMARVGVNSPDFLKEYAKAKATLHQMDSYNQLQTQQQAQGQANPIQNIGQSGTNVGQPMPNTSQGGLGQNSSQNQQNPTDNGNSAMNLPQ